MTAFVTPVDIGNRALQHLGVPRIGSLTDNSKQAAEVSFMYDKCRRAELRANLWNFSARRVILRPYMPATSTIWGTAAWNVGTTYGLGSIVFYNGINWISTATANLGATPGTGNPTFGWAEFPQPQFLSPFVTGTTYYGGEMVIQGGLIYIAAGATNVAPPASPPWVLISPSLTMATPSFFFPQGVTTNTLGTPKIAYPMPIGYIRVMPQDPKVAATPIQLSTAGMQYSDFEFENGFLFTASPGPMVFRFSADLQNVIWFEDLFCEALACRIALELVEALTQSPQKSQMISALYEENVTKAQRVNAIEAGSTEPDTADVKTNRTPSIEKEPAQPRQQQR